MSTTLADAIVDAYILAAEEMVTNVLSTDTTLSAALLKEIGRWLAAHMIAATKERMETEAGAGGAYIKYAGTFGEAFSSTPYGQMVLQLDTTGKFASLGCKVASMSAIQGPSRD
jgi:hypothetical protein